MVLNPVPGGEEPTLQLPLAVPPAEPPKVAPRGLDSGGDDALEEASPGTVAPVEIEPPRLAIDNGGGGDTFVAEPMVPRIEALSGSRSQADKPPDALSAMPKAPVLDLGIEFAVRVAPNDVAADAPDGATEAALHEPSEVVDGSEAASAEASAVGAHEMGVPQAVAQNVAAFEPKPSAEVLALPVERRSLSTSRTSAREPQKRAAPGIEPLASALDAAVRLATDASVAAEALEKLKVLLQHKHQLEGLRSGQPLEDKQRVHAIRSAQPVLARSSRGAEASASEAHAIAFPASLPLPPLPLPVPAGEASMGRSRLPLVQRRRALLERRGLDVRGFMAGFALSWAFGVVLYFFMTAG
jgi:hypothetical protein